MAFFNNSMNRFPAAFCFIEHVRKALRLDFEADRFLNDSVEVSAGSPSDSVAIWADWFKLDPYSLAYRSIEPGDFSAAETGRIHDMVQRAIWCFGRPWRRFFCKLIAPLPHLEAVQALFPESRFIYLIRDPRMTANSMLKHCRAEIERQEEQRLYRMDPVAGKQYFVPYPRFPCVTQYIERFGLEDPRTTASIWNDFITYTDAVKPRLRHCYDCATKTSWPTATSKSAACWSSASCHCRPRTAAPSGRKCRGSACCGTRTVTRISSRSKPSAARTCANTVMRRSRSRRGSADYSRLYRITRSVSEDSPVPWGPDRSSRVIREDRWARRPSSAATRVSPAVGWACRFPGHRLWNRR